MKRASPSTSDWLHATLQRLHGLVNQPIQCLRSGPGMRLIIAPALAPLAQVQGVPGEQQRKGIDQSPAWALRHAALSLARLDGDGLNPGLAGLRRRVELVLRRRLGDRPLVLVKDAAPSGTAGAPSRFPRQLDDLHGTGCIER